MLPLSVTGSSLLASLPYTEVQQKKGLPMRLYRQHPFHLAIALSSLHDFAESCGVWQILCKCIA